MRTTVALDDDLVRILCSGSKEMRNHLNEGQIVIHPSIIAELALALPEERSLQVAQSEMVQRETVKPTPAFVPVCGSPDAAFASLVIGESDRRHKKFELDSV